MSRDIESAEFRPQDEELFCERLTTQLQELHRLLRDPAFGEGERTIGAELELCIIDRNAKALPLNRTLAARHADVKLQLEIDRFNLEYNLSPVPARGRPFCALQLQLHNALAALNHTAASFDARVVPVGILPTLTERDLTAEALTDLPRYRALNERLRQLRHTPFEIRIDGDDPLTLTAADIALEGANTSFQLHLRVAPREFADFYNAAQLVTPVALALGANSPIFLGHQLWDETRVALFKQSLDARALDQTKWRAPARVSYGHGWVRDGAWELFAESVALFPPLLPRCETSSPNGDRSPPALRELRRHMGTIWRWNRAVYDDEDGGHVRIEFRALPAGPTPLDMVANAAFLLGATAGLAPHMTTLLPGIPFALAEWNFYRAAQAGLDARLVWPSERSPSPIERPVFEIGRDLLPIAEEGLSRLGVEDEESSRLLGVIRSRMDARQTGARWMRSSLERARAAHGMPVALADVVEGYVARAATGRPVHEWDLLQP